MNVKAHEISLPTVWLYAAVGLGLIVEYPSGVAYANQVGGYSCLQQGLEGVYVPIANEVLLDKNVLWSPENELRDYFVGPKHQGMGATAGIDAEDAIMIEKILAQYNVQWIKVDRSRFEQSCEAWVWVELHLDDPVYPLKGFDPFPRSGVLTWNNSD